MRRMIAEGRVIQRRRLRQAAEMIEHDRRRQAFEQRRILDDLVGAHVDLHVPAEISDALGQRLDHVDRDGGGARIEHREADAADAAVGERLQFRIGDGRMHHRDAARVRGAQAAGCRRASRGCR